MIKLPENNFNVRLQLISCCLADKAKQISDKQKLGVNCVEELKKLQYFTILLEILRCYTVDDSLTEEDQDAINSFDACTLDKVFENFSKYCKECYPAPEAELINC